MWSHCSAKVIQSLSAETARIRLPFVRAHVSSDKSAIASGNSLFFLPDAENGGAGAKYRSKSLETVTVSKGMMRAPIASKNAFKRACARAVVSCVLSANGGVEEETSPYSEAFTNA